MEPPACLEPGPPASGSDTDGAGAAVSGAPAREILQALICARRDEFTEALAHALRAREWLPRSGVHLAALLDAFVDCQSRYRDAQRDLLEASRRFAAAGAEQQERIAALEALLPRFALESEDEPPAAPPEGPGEHAEIPGPPDAPTPPAPGSLPPLSISCFGRFIVRRAGKHVRLCQNRNGQAILRYLAAHPRHRETVDVLMEVLWPDDEPDVARHKLHVAISALRRALNGEFERQKGAGYLLCENGAYALNPEAAIQLDVDDFIAQHRAGQRSAGDAAMAHFETACRLYTGPLLIEDLYAEWSVATREQLALHYLAMCGALAGHHFAAGRYADCERWATAVLAENSCDEPAHRLLLRAYAAQGRRGDVLRQYRRCERALADELGVAPMPETTALFEAARRGEPLPELDEEAQCA